MKVIFRVDSSLKIGTGHVMRCLALAEVLKENDVNVEFICRKHKESLIGKIRSSGFVVESWIGLDGSCRLPSGCLSAGGSLLDHDVCRVHAEPQGLALGKHDQQPFLPALFQIRRFLHRKRESIIRSIGFQYPMAGGCHTDALRLGVSASGRDFILYLSIDELHPRFLFR